ncbi:hypothetical protein DSL72_002739 [Monilinia vaccinii-corymbosi]|uniref:RING-type domain-containing protein n=1 Tax=Monilinia vaccinii-corymbosi TaxID=61207 RepID=A0A8A3PDK2_9HELO|nr:hypothetical protein DSL72_002739 [Monilinia vaccinii-corymbosi]
MEEDNDVDMPYPPPLPPQAAASRCPNPQASRNGMQMPYSQFPELMTTWSGLPVGYNVSLYGTPNMPPISYGGGPSPGYAPGYAPPTDYNVATGYTATSSYAAHYAQWSQTAQAQGNTYTRHQDVQPSGSRRFLPHPHSNHPLGNFPSSGSWGNSPDDFRVPSRLSEVNPVAGNNHRSQGLNYMDNGGPPGLSREQAQQRWREQDRSVAAEVQALTQNPLGNVSSNNPNLSSNHEWDHPRPGRMMAVPQRRGDVSTHAMRDLDTDEEEIANSDDDDDDDDDDIEAILGYSQYLRTAEAGTFASTLRGRLGSAEVNGKRMPSKEFLLSLENLKPDDLSKEERTCMICYNEFGVKNPEGVSEQPLRLPKCKHVFGAICIKKWFKENDSCPYCRDRVPSESSRKLVMRQARQLVQDQIRRRYHSTARSTEANPAFSAGPNQQEHHNMYMYSGDRTSPAWLRPSTADTAESRRRVARGRTGGHRAAHPSTRTNPMSSARAYTTPTPQLPNEPDSPSHTHARHNSNSEGVSPAIAVGSTTSNGEQQSASLSANSFGNSANPNNYMTHTTSSLANPAFSNNYMSPSVPSYSQSRPTAFGSGRPFQADTPNQFYHYHPQPPQEDASVAFQNPQQAMLLMQRVQREHLQQQEERLREAEDELGRNL